MTSVRMDKWLWAARFFKTRALASKACDLGRIRTNGLEAKPAREVRVGDMLQVKNEGGEFEIEVLQLSEMRGPAAVAQTLYRETDASKEARLQRGRRAQGDAAVRADSRSAGRASATGAGSFSFAAARDFCRVIDRCAARDIPRMRSLVDSTAACVCLFVFLCSLLVGLLLAGLAAPVSVCPRTGHSSVDTIAIRGF